MELLRAELFGRPLRLEGTMAGWQQLYWDHNVVSQREATASDEEDIQHVFELQTEQGLVRVCVALTLRWKPFDLRYEVTVNGQKVSGGDRSLDNLARETPTEIVPEKKQLSLVGLASLGFKLLKSAKVIKVVFAGASVAAYSWLFSFQFALALIGCLVFHEYGHIRAMKYFGMKTKGIYLIPFVGGLALGDNKINTRWQDVVISIMGPSFGLLLSLLCLLLYLLTGEMIFAGLAAFNALLNLFNLLPILPLDGGHILKSISFSMDSRLGITLCAIAAAGGVYLSYEFGLALLGFMLLIGSVEILVEWKSRHQSRLYPLDFYGQIFSITWYLVTVLGLIGVLWYFAGTGDEMLGLPLKVLQS
ncbi:site-2 protease family protein [Gammaproteobacteria bacterium 45_16_T64]|nr:site-2 protease family protein [Gammaproteobacteria bacterium 45_16_T64]